MLKTHCKWSLYEIFIIDKTLICKQKTRRFRSYQLQKIFINRGSRSSGKLSGQNLQNQKCSLFPNLAVTYYFSYHLAHMWLMSQHNPCEMQHCCQCTFLKHFSITKHILAKKKFFIVAIFLKWHFLFYLVNQRITKFAFITLEALVFA